MAKYTLLEMVQLTLNSMDSDEVETITETIESNQVADIFRETFEEMLDRRAWEFMQNRTRQLDTAASGPAVQLDIPDGVTHIKDLYYHDYDTGDKVILEYVSPAEFIRRTVNRDSSQSYFEAATVGDGVNVVVYNDRAPSFYTSFDEITVVCDGYDVANEANLTGANSIVLAEVRPTWTKSDSFVPAIPERMFGMLLNEGMSQCWIDLKQAANQKRESKARRNYIKLRELERQVVKDREEINYGR